MGVNNLFQSNAIVLIFIIYFSILLVVVQESYPTRNIKFSKNIMILLSLFLKINNLICKGTGNL